MLRARPWLRVAWAALRARSNRSFYDRIAGIYDTVFTDHRIHVDGVVRLLTERYPDGSRRPLVLDLGCGTGVLGKALVDRGFRVVGLDFSRRSLQCLHQRDSGMACLLADIEFLPISDRCFDAEREALQMLDERFEKTHRIPSGPHWALLEGRFPRR